jgi:AraC-like DNA-binding protein
MMTSTMPRPAGRISPAAMRPLLDVAASRGLARAELLGAVGLDRRACDDERSEWLPAVVTDRLWSTAEARLGVEVPLQVATTVEPASFGLLTYLLACCDNVVGALTGLESHYGLLSTTTRYGVEVDARGATLWADLRGSRPPCVEAFTLAVALSFLRREARGPLVVREVRLRQEAPDAAGAHAHATAFAAPVRYRAAMPGLVLAASALSLPLRRAEPGLREILTAHAASLLSEPAAEALAPRVRQQIALGGAHCSVRAGDVAGELGMSERTLRRLLLAEGTSFRAELDAVLAASARERLDGETVESVAAALGFSDAAAFRRAFRRWSGCTPRGEVAAAE